MQSIPNLLNCRYHDVTVVLKYQMPFLLFLGAAYSVHKEKAQKAEPILPVVSVLDQTIISKHLSSSLIR